MTEEFRRLRADRVTRENTERTSETAEKVVRDSGATLIWYIASYFLMTGKNSMCDHRANGSA